VTGPNGSGKTTLLRILARLAVPTAGTVELPERSSIGYLGHEPLVYRDLTALANRVPVARQYRVEPERVGLEVERVDLWEVRNERVSTFSRGMQQRLGLCRVLLHDPSLLLLDEPTNALDAQGLELLDAVLDEPRLHVVATHDPARFDARATERLVFA
jgi:heme exporter protein A